MKAKAKKISDELRPEYNFDYSKAVCGKYYKRILDEGANVVMLEPDVAKAFVDSAAVNDALRSLLDLTKTTQRLTLIRPPVVKRKNAPKGKYSKK